MKEKRNINHYEIKNFEKFNKKNKNFSVRDKTRDGNAYRQERKNKRRYA